LSFGRRNGCINEGRMEGGREERKEGKYEERIKRNKGNQAGK
jgi:hypothetical protein